MPTTTLPLLLACVATALIIRADAQRFSVDGLNYNARKGPDWAPESAKCKSLDEIKLDMQAVKTVTSAVRLYSLVDCNQGALVIPAALEAGLKVSVGLWVSDNPAVFQAEKAKLQELIQPERDIFRAGKIVDIHVGSEAIYRKEVTAATNIEYMKEIKALCSQHANTAKIPITIAEIGDTYLEHRELIDAVDIVSANGFPFWEKWAAATSAERFDKRMEPLFTLADKAGKGMSIGETGWASAGSSNKSSEASPANALLYLRDFKAMAESRGWRYFYFAAFDEPWKIEGAKEDTVEAHFGLFNTDRSLKDVFRTLTDSATGISAPAPTPSRGGNPESASETGTAESAAAAGSPSTLNGGSPAVTPAPTPVPASPTPSPTTHPAAAAATATGDAHRCTTA